MRHGAPHRRALKFISRMTVVIADFAPFAPDPMVPNRNLREVAHFPASRHALQRIVWFLILMEKNWLESRKRPVS
jgi:hypothetical protein